MASLGSSEFWLRDIADRGTKTGYQGTFSGVLESASLTTSHLHQFGLCVQSWWECGSGWNCFVTTGNSWWTWVGTLMTSFMKHQSSLLKSEHLGTQWVDSVCVMLISSLDWLSMNYWVDWMDRDSSPRGRSYGWQKGNMPGWATG